MKEIRTLGDVLQTIGVKKPFRHNGEPTKAGWKAYDKLINIVYAFNTMGVITERECYNMIKTLDEIVELKEE